MALTRTRFGTALAATLAAALVATPTLSDAATTAAPTPTVDPSYLPVVGEGITAAFDSRAGLDRLAPTTAQRTAVGRIAGAQVAWNASGTPRAISRVGGALSGPSSAAPATIARGWLTTNAAAFGLTAADMSALQVVRDHELPDGVGTVVSFTQTFGGVASGYGGILTVLVDRTGRVVSYTGDPVRSSSLRGAFDLTPVQAITKTLAGLLPALDLTPVATGRTQGGYDVFRGGPALADVLRVRKVAFPTPTGGRAAYAVLVVKSADEAWAVIVDAASGKPLLRKSLVAHASEGTVYENYPGAAKGGKPKTVNFGPTEQSPGGFVDPTGLAGLPGVTTLGNNANTAIAWTVPLVAADQQNRPVAPTSEFDFAFPDSWAKSDGATGSFVADANAAAVNLFYHHNRIHDELYEFGFTETAGNFQLVNHGDGLGLGGDPIMGGAQSGALNLTEPVLALGRNNANMLTLPDGIPGFTNMYLWEHVDDVFEAPARDGDFDATIIQHEYSHGLSNRYVGGGGLGSLGTVQSGAMGEGWGDWYAMNDLFRRGLTRTAVTAPYVGDPQRGIRNWNYATSPATYGDYGYDMSGPEVHSDGEIWTAALWTLRTRILKAVGGDQVKASDITEHLVTDAMPISPPSPSFLDMRDAILKAAELRYGDRYTALVWKAFAERGMGLSARTAGETDTDPKPGFDVPGTGDGTVTLKVRNASTGKPARGIRVLGGMFDGRATPVTTTSRSGTARVTMLPGTHRLTLQAPGFGIQRVRVSVKAGRTTAEKISLKPNLLSISSGAKVVKVTSQAAALPGTNLVDDTEATAWQTGARDASYNSGPDRSVTVKMKKKAKLRSVAVSVVKPIGLPRFAAAREVVVQTSTDGKRWKRAATATFSFRGPRPAVPDLALKTVRLKKPVTARYVRAVATKALGTGAENASTAIVAEVQAYGDAKGITPRLPAADKPVRSRGSVTAGNIAQGTLLGLDPYRPGATELSWAGSCPGLPAANGADAWMTKLPAGAGDGLHAVTYTGSVPIGEFLVYAYDEDCAPMTGGFALLGEATPIPAGASYVGFLLLYGAGAEVDVTITEPR